MNFILDTGQLYTHGIFINSAVFGTAANGAVTLSIAGTTNTLALSNHTHSNYLENNADIDITGHKIDLVEEGTLKPFAVESVNRDKRLIYERTEKR